MIFRKEVSDAVSSGAFLLSITIFFITVILCGLASGYSYTRILYIVQAQPSQIPYYNLMIIRNLSPIISLIGVIVVVAYGYSMVNKEREDGSWKVLLSYPIYRDQVILGKLLAGLFVLLVTLFSAIAVAFVIFIFYSGAFITVEMLTRLAAFFILSFLLLSAWMGLSIFISLAFKEPKTSLLTLLLLIGLYNTFTIHNFGRLIIDLLIGPLTLLTSQGVALNDASAAFLGLVTNIFSSNGFNMISYWLSLPKMITSVGMKRVEVPSTVLNIFLENIPPIMFLAFLSIITFAASYVIFTRRDLS